MAKGRKKGKRLNSLKRRKILRYNSKLKSIDNSKIVSYSPKIRLVNY